VRAWRILPTEEDEDQREERRMRDQATAKTAPAPLPLKWTLVLWAVALLPRLYSLFFLTDPENAGDGWHGDVYHHWQIAYLTQQIGLTAPGGPRLWDLKGLDYYWGILHPVMLVVLFFVTGSIDIILARLLSLVFGAIVVVLIFHLCRRYWGTRVAVAAAAFAALAPTSVFVDSTGFLEPIGVALSLLGIWLYPKRGVWTGIAWALAAMARAEAWIFSFGMLVATFLRRQAIEQRLAMVVAWAVGILVYMKILLDRTGNPIYPVWWNFLANAFGKWEFRTELTPTEHAAQPVLGALVVLALIGLVWTLIKRPRSYMFLTFGFGYLVFTGGFLGFTAYIKSWESWFWMERFFVFPYEFAAVLGAILLFIVLPRLLGSRAILLAWALTAVSLLAVQLEWPPIMAEYNLTRTTWQETLTAGFALGSIYNQPGYQGTIISLPNGDPALTYVLARFDRVDGKYLMSQLYDPFYYLPGYTYADHRETAGVLMQCWLTTTRTRLFVIDPQNLGYVEFVQDHPEWFRKVGDLAPYQWIVEDTQIPLPSAADCTQASRSARGQGS